MSPGWYSIPPLGACRRDFDFFIDLSLKDSHQISSATWRGYVQRPTATNSIKGVVLRRCDRFMLTSPEEEQS
jgi:hypothetical protein